MKSNWSQKERTFGAKILTREALFQTMEYLGYPKGEATTKTVDALIAISAVECPELVPQIATEYTKHVIQNLLTNTD